MNSTYIESTCGLHNGVRFEELQVDSFYDDNSPRVYRVVFAVWGSLKDSIYRTQIDRIYFNRPTDMYLWHSDTSSYAVYRRVGLDRERIDRKAELVVDTPALVNLITDSDSLLNLEAETNGQVRAYQAALSKTCPLTFKPDTWYYVDFYDQRYRSYLYVDRQMNFRLDKISLPANF